MKAEKPTSEMPPKELEELSYYNFMGYTDARATGTVIALVGVFLVVKKNRK